MWIYIQAHVFDFAHQKSELMAVSHQTLVARLNSWYSLYSAVLGHGANGYGLGTTDAVMYTEVYGSGAYNNN